MPRKTNAERVEQAYALLGVTPAQADELPRIREVIKRAKLAGRMVSYLRGSSDPDAKRWLSAYDSVPKASAALLPPEAFCAAITLAPERLFGALAEAVFTQSRSESALLAAVAHPEVVEATIEAAKGPEGVRDREMLHKAAQFLPLPKAATFVNLPGVKSIDARVQTQQTVVLQPAEQDVRRLSDRFGERLLEGPQTKLLEPVIEASEDDGEDEEDQDVG